MARNAEQASGRFMRRGWPRREAAQPAVQISVVLRRGRILQRVAPLADRHRPQQQLPKAGCEHRVTILDGVFRVAQQMRQAHLPHGAMPQLTAIAVGHPHFRLCTLQERGHH
jgi:hypothetical protein